MDRFRFCETHFTTYQRFVADQSAISPFLGGLFLLVFQRDKVGMHLFIDIHFTTGKYIQNHIQFSCQIAMHRQPHTASPDIYLRTGNLSCCSVCCSAFCSLCCSTCVSVRDGDGCLDAFVALAGTHCISSDICGKQIFETDAHTQTYIYTHTHTHTYTQT